MVPPRFFCQNGVIPSGILVTAGCAILSLRFEYGTYTESRFEDLVISCRTGFLITSIHPEISIAYFLCFDFSCRAILIGYSTFEIFLIRKILMIIHPSMLLFFICFKLRQHSGKLSLHLFPRLLMFRSISEIYMVLSGIK